MPNSTRRQQIEQMLQDDPQDVFLRYALAMECASGGDDAAAVQEFQRVIAESSDYVPAYFQCAQTLVRLARSAEARDVLQRGIAVAQRAGEQHTAEEMQALLATL